LLHHSVTSFIGCLTSDDCTGNFYPVHKLNKLTGRRAGSRERTILMRTKRAKTAEKRSKPGRIHAVLTTLGREIAQDIIPAGAVLPPENNLEARFGVGRGVVREAIKTLSGKGLISVQPRHGTRVLPRRDWSLLDRDVLSWLIGDEKPDLELLLAVQEVRSIIEPAAAALAATRATKSDLEHINAALRAMENSDDQASATAADKSFHLAILDATHNPVLQGFRGAIDTILSAVFVVAVDRIDGWFVGNIPNHAAAARAIEEGNAKKARAAMERVLGYTQSKLAKRNRQSNRRKGPPGKATNPRRKK
jgi:GntR family galactonate operon transcriptional repressor